jgi:hypothetical protein
MSDDHANYIGHYYRCGFQFFIPVAMYHLLEQGIAISERMTMIRQMWKNLSPIERQVYNDQAEHFNRKLCEEFMTCHRAYENKRESSLPDARKCNDAICRKFGLM